MEMRKMRVRDSLHFTCYFSFSHTIQYFLLNLYADDIMKNAGLDEAQAGIKIAGKNINNLKYADGTTLMAESEE